MAIVKPFRALRPLPERAADVSAVPYDVVNSTEAAQLAEGNALSFLRVSRPEIELPSDTDIYSDAVYAQATANFDRLMQAAPLTLEDEPTFYLYRLKMGEPTQTGLVACCSVDEYDNDVILKHERTTQYKEDDRTRHILSLRAQTGPVFLAYRGTEAINAQVAEHTASAPLFDFTAVDGVAHTLWRVPVTANAAISEAFGAVANFYIADGHHRAKSASRAREALRAANAAHTGTEEYNFFQGVLFPADQLRILAYNRAVKDLNGYASADFLDAVRGDFYVTENAVPAPAEPHHFSMYFEGRWYGLKLRSDVTQRLRAIDRLDVSVLQDHLLAPVLGIQDPRTDRRIHFVGGIRGTAELEKLVNEGQAAVAFSLYATTLDDLMNVSDAGEIMPPKSTWFEPKLRDGLLSHLI
ncbi:MAG: DUF1015 domain-containing protein [Acidobacteria bacterium]|nr:DUF1015 domain-containing protein [Acidobacteriota bacterium]